MCVDIYIYNIFTHIRYYLIIEYYEDRTLMNIREDQMQNTELHSNLACVRVGSHLVDGWQMLWPRSLGFWLWVLIASGKTAGVAYCTSALLLGFPRWPVRSICGWQKGRKRLFSYFSEQGKDTRQRRERSHYLSISFCTSSMCSIASCCSFSKRR